MRCGASRLDLHFTFWSLLACLLFLFLNHITRPEEGKQNCIP